MKTNECSFLYRVRHGACATPRVLRGPVRGANSADVMADQQHILLIIGSPRRASYTRSLARHIDRALIARGARTETADLYETPLPPLDLELRGQRGDHPDAGVADLCRQAVNASAYVLATPTYHNSFSGSLKTALDYLTLRDMRYRPVGLVAHSGRSTQPVDQLRQVVRGLLGIAIPTQVCTRDSDYAAEPDADGLYQIRDRDILARVERFADELVLFDRHMRALRAELDAGTAQAAKAAR